MNAAVEPRIVLVVDDAPANIDIVRAVLHEHYRVRVATTGERALKIAKGHQQPDLILLDVMMPGMDGYAVCEHLKTDPSTAAIPIIFLTAKTSEEDESRGLNAGAVDYITKPISPPILLARVRTHLNLADQNNALEHLVQQRTSQLQAAEEALREAMNNLRVTKVTTGVYWLQVPEAGLYVLCGCPAEVVKHLMRRGYIASEQQRGTTCETGPNAILLSDLPIQNGVLSNMAEFPVLQMLYRQGMLLPDHPNNTGEKPILIGSSEQVQAQLAYIHRGNYGLLSREEIMATGVDAERADELMRVKLHFAFGAIRPPESFVNVVAVSAEPSEVRNGVTVRRVGLNRFEFQFRGKSAEVDLNLGPEETYEAPYTLDYHTVKRTYFGVLHSGEGDGWDVNRPSMSSVLMFQGRIYLVDAPPNIDQILSNLAIDISEVYGIFHTHAHDDHFAGLPTLMRAGHRIKYFTTPLVRSSVTKKFSALMGMEERRFAEFFEVHDLRLGEWNECGGFEVKPVYSPHPVETNLFMFRALTSEGFRSYAHWADLTAFDVLQRMTDDTGPVAGMSPEFVAGVKADYLEEADLKKLDIGGGLIHGQARDFRDDGSKRIVLAHVARALTDQEQEIGSAAGFGALDVLIKGQQDYLRRRAHRRLASYFPGASDSQTRALLNAPVISVNAGSIIRRRGQEVPYLDMILSGRVQYVDAEKGVRYRLSIGSFVGEHAVTGASPPAGTWRAESHVTLLRIQTVLFESFLDATGLRQQLREMVERIDFLRQTWLFGEQLTFGTLNLIAQAMQPVPCAAGEIVDPAAAPALYLLAEGNAVLEDARRGSSEPLHRGDFFGEQWILGLASKPLICRAESEAFLLRVADYPLKEIPIIHWKMLEVAARRKTGSSA